jgi:N-methylhydantoinase A
MVRLATDVGGTFTDLVAYDEKTGEISIAKTLTTSDDQSRGVLDTIAQARDAHGLDPTGVGFFVHGGTTVINAITERKGVKTALITTKGFRDVLEIARGNRPDLYNLQARTPEPFVPRRLRLEVEERLDAQGEILVALNKDDIRAAAEVCRREHIEAAAVVFLHSYVNPDHEERCTALLRELLPGVAISPSYQVSRQWREYERSNTTVLNAYVQPIIERYFATMQQSLIAEGITCAPYAMQSNGGVATFAQAGQQPLTLVESGPSGGVAGAVSIGEALGEADILHLDVGGTTAKCSLIRGGRPQLTPDYKLEWSRTSPGYPVQIPVVDIVEIGAGGGSIAWLDDLDGLHVGPESAGSTPGPVCYGRGGNLPTVTDAKLVIGILNPESFGNRRMTLDRDLARESFADIARRLDMKTEDAAAAIVRIAEASMINALKLVTVQRGHDPRDLVLVVSGGAGPMMAAKLGRELRAKATAIPLYPGIFSAWGMLAAKPRADLRQTYFGPADEQTIRSIASDRFAALRAEAVTYFGLENDAALNFHPKVEARYKGQEHSVLADFALDWNAQRFVAAFHAAHETAYSFNLPDTQIEITNLHLQAELDSKTVRLASISDRSPVENPKPATRKVYFGADMGWRNSPVLERDHLPINTPLEGPLLIEEATTTTLVLPGQELRVTDVGILAITECANEIGRNS